MEKLNNALEEIVKYIENTEEYKKCILLKKRMDDNSDIIFLTNEIKKVQKDYVNGNYKLDDKLEDLENKLNEIPIYNMYLKELEKVNIMINYVNDRINDYFYTLLNKDTID